MVYMSNDNLPKGWVWTTLEEISKIILGQSPPSSAYNTDGEGLPFYQGKLEFGETYPTPQKWCTAPKKIAEKGDVFISVRAPVGPTNLCPEKSCVGRGLAAIRGLSDIEPFFILYLMRAYEDELAGRGVGTTFNAITGNQLKTFEIPLSPLPEQHRIVAKIEELFTKLDAGINELHKAQSQLKRYRQSVLKAAFEGKLTEAWRAEHQDEIEPAAPIASDLPKEWTWAMVGKIAQQIHYGYTESATNDPIGPKFLRITDIQNNSVNWDSVPYCRIDEVKQQQYLLKENDLVFARTGATVGKSFLIQGSIPDAVFASYLIRIVLEKETNAKFVYTFFQSQSYWMQIHQGKVGSGQPNVNAKVLSQITLPLPPLPEQQAIVSEVESRLSVADEVEKTVTAELKRAEQLRQSILKKAFSGELVPQDPNDEPASALLERIKVQKEIVFSENLG